MGAKERAQAVEAAKRFEQYVAAAKTVPRGFICGFDGGLYYVAVSGVQRFDGADMVDCDDDVALKVLERVLHGVDHGT